MKAIISLVLLAILSHSYGQSLGGNTVTGGLVSLEDFSEAEDLWNQYNGLLRNVNGKRENLRLIELSNVEYQVTAGQTYYLTGIFRDPRKRNINYECEIKIYYVPYAPSSSKVTLLSKTRA